MEEIKAHVLSKLYGTNYPQTAVNLENEFTKVYKCMENTITQHRGQQCVLLGSRSTGKTMLIEKALGKLQTKYDGHYFVIRINGSIHSEDRLALRSIARQLDTLIDNGNDDIEKASMSQTLKGLNKLFEMASVSEHPEHHMNVIFIVEELDIFCQTHQVLAYELLDLSQSCPFGVGFIGTSTRFNIGDLLEKRNRSRNTALTLTIPKPENQKVLEDIGRALLGIDDLELKVKYPEECNQWKTFVNEINLGEIAEAVYFTSNSARHLCSELQNHVLGIQNLAANCLPTICYSELLLSSPENVSELEWALLICAARAVARYNTPTVNFIIVLDEWKDVADRTFHDRFASEKILNSLKPSSNPAILLSAKYAWEKLIKMRLLEASNANATQEELRMYIPELDLDDLKACLPQSFSLYAWTNIGNHV